MSETSLTEPIVGVDLGGTKILAVVVTGEREIIARCKKRTKPVKGCDAVLGRVVAAIRGALEQAELEMEDVSAVGIGVPGPVDSEQGVINAAPNLGWGRVEVANILSDRIGRPVFLGNDTNLCTLGELDLGAGRGVDSIVGVFVGTGIGGGIVIDGRLIEGSSGTAGEFGHMIIKYDGAKANTGWRGTVESLAARPAIVARIVEQIRGGKKSVLPELVEKKLGEWDPEAANTQISSSFLAKAYKAGDKVVRRAVDESAYLTGIGLAATVHLLNPEMVVVGGGVVEAIGEPYVEIVEDAIRANTFPAAHRDLKVVEAALGDDAGVLGAVSLVRRRLAEEPALSGVG
ncbi:MAG: ROK family protein [Phycisphaerae bacterium]|nr:ROK family protein [Phycisphaerae bacterium]